MTEAEEKELRILEAMDAGKISKDEALELMELEGLSAKKAEKEEKSFLSEAGDMALKALDYTSGIGRTAAAGIADLAAMPYFLAGGEDYAGVTRSGDFTRMLKGDAPTTEELLTRAGMDDGGLKSTIGFIGDVGLDPATYLSGGTAAAAPFEVAHSGTSGRRNTAWAPPPVSASHAPEGPAPPPPSPLVAASGSAVSDPGTCTSPSPRCR